MSFPKAFYTRRAENFKEPDGIKMLWIPVRKKSILSFGQKSFPQRALP
jgi:hypothetical protein